MDAFLLMADCRMEFPDYFDVKKNKKSSNNDDNNNKTSEVKKEESKE